MPKLWSDTIESHRASVREAIIDTTAGLVAEHGLLSVTMSRIAKQTGIGRATLYKYFPDVESILLASHARKVEGHLEQLVAIGDRPGSPVERLAAVLESYVRFSDHRSHGHDAATEGLLHNDASVIKARAQLSGIIADLVSEGIAAGDLRKDVAPAELANFCLSAVAGARSLPSRAAVHRLIGVTLDGLRSHG